MKTRALVLLIAIGAAGIEMPRAQGRTVAVDELQGHTALGLALRHLSNAGIFMMATAHPDDENNALLVMLNRGQGFRTALATATRGNGGQNEIGPELSEALGVLRTEELAAMHRFDGAEQYFTRAVDFGNSFSVQETFDKWGREEIVRDYVRLIRMVRPDVMTGLTPTGDASGQHHQASAVLAHEAFLAAGDPARFPEQISGGLRPWQPKKFYYAEQVGNASSAQPKAGAGQLIVNLSAYDRLLGKTYQEIGSEARSMHKCQGTPQMLSLPGPATAGYLLSESTLPNGLQRPDTALFDGIDTSIAGLAGFVSGRVPRELNEGLRAMANAIQQAQRRFDTENDAATLQPLLIGLRAVRALRAQLRAMPIPDVARFEIEYRLRQKEREFQQAILIANGVRIEALADDGVVVPGQLVNVSVYIANRGGVDVAVKQVKFDGFEADFGCSLTQAVGGGRGRGAPPPPPGPAVSTLTRDQVAQCVAAQTIPADARLTEPYWHREGEAGRYTFDEDAPFGLPYRPTPFYVQVTFGFVNSEDVIGGLAIGHRYQDDIFTGEKRAELLVVPPVSVRLSPEVMIVPAGALTPPPPPPPAAPTRGTPPRPTATQGRGARGTPPPAPPPPPSVTLTKEARVTLVNDVKGAAEVTVRLDVPQNWTFTPAQQVVKFTREDESQTVRFQIKPPFSAPADAYGVKAIATLGGVEYTRGFQAIEYPHIRRQHVYNHAAGIAKVIDVKTSPNLIVGYVMGVGDAVPPAIEQLGAKVEFIGPDDLAWGNLTRFPTIVLGVRAYERRADLRANNARLLEYVRDGGTLIVQYNKTEFNEAPYGPYTAEVSSDRTTDEHAPARILAPADPALNTPNKIGDAAWDGWIQERGLYFLGEKDSRYRDLVAFTDPFPNNPGEKRGALVLAQYGKGRWAYVGLGLWRQLPAGVDGAYQLLANLISLGH